MLCFSRMLVRFICSLRGSRNSKFVRQFSLWRTGGASAKMQAEWYRNPAALNTFVEFPSFGSCKFSVVKARHAFAGVHTFLSHAPIGGH